MLITYALQQVGDLLTCSTFVYHDKCKHVRNETVKCNNKSENDQIIKCPHEAFQSVFLRSFHGSSSPQSAKKGPANESEQTNPTGTSSQGH